MQVVQLAIVIVHYRTLELTLDCLRALAKEVSAHAPAWRIVVVDNASGDGSAELVEQFLRDHGCESFAELLHAAGNHGFSAGNNVGLRHLEAEYYLLLNSDATPRPGAIAELLRAAKQHPEAGLVSPRLLHPDGSLHHSCYRWLRPRSEFLDAAHTGLLTRLLRWELLFPHSDQPVRPEWTSFACVLLTRRSRDQVGLLDEGFFLYYEDQDYGRRVWKAGLQVLHWPSAVVVHAAGGSGPVRADLAALRRPPRYLYASRSRYFAKYYGVMGLWASNALWWIGRSISLLREWCGLKQGAHVCERQALDLWTGALHPLRPWRSSTEQSR